MCLSAVQAMLDFTLCDLNIPLVSSREKTPPPKYMPTQALDSPCIIDIKLNLEKNYIALLVY